MAAAISLWAPYVLALRETRMSQTGRDPPASTSTASKARLTVLATRVRRRPIGSWSGGPAIADLLHFEDGRVRRGHRDRSLDRCEGDGAVTIGHPGSHRVGHESRCQRTTQNPWSTALVSSSWSMLPSRL